MLFISSLFMTTCNEAVVGSMTKLEDGSVWLTSDYVYLDKTTAIPTMLPTAYPVNPEGISIKTAYIDSEGIRHIEVMGTVRAYQRTDAGTRANGIPDGLHAIKRQDTGNYFPTDYVAPAIMTPVYPGSATMPKDVPLENLISLKSLYENSNYTAITISGLAGSASWIRMKETTQTVLLYTDQYLNGFTSAAAMYNKQSPAFRELIFTLDPNVFWDGGHMPSGTLIERGSGGGLNLLLWSGASPRKSTFDFSTDSGKTWNTTIVDYSGVSFEPADLQYMAWYNVAPTSYYPPYNTGTNPINVTAITKGTITGNTYTAGSPDANDIYTGFEITVDELALGLAVDDFLTPSFYPISAANKQVYMTNDNLANGPKTSIRQDLNLRVEIADRIRVTRLTPNAIDLEISIFCNTYPPSASPGTAVPIELRMKIDCAALP